jgi:hypothetical protein
LQTLWVSFATEATQSVGLTYTKPAADVMQRRPRPPSVVAEIQKAVRRRIATKGARAALLR